MLRHKKWILLFFGIFVILQLAGCSQYKEEDAQKLVQAQLDLRLQGDGEAAAKLDKEKSRSELLLEYEMWIQAIDEVYLTGDMEVDDDLQKLFLELTKEIMQVMRYNVQEVTKSGEDFEVKVEVAPVDLFECYIPKIEAASKDLTDRVEKGEYEGTDQEIEEQIEGEYLYLSYELLREAFQEMKYEDAVTVTLRVERTEEKEYEVNEDDISKMIMEMLHLDESQ